MLTTLKILKGKALLHKTIKIADGTMSVKDYVAGALADYTDESLVAKKVKVGENFEEGEMTAIPVDILARVPLQDVASAGACFLIRCEHDARAPPAPAQNVVGGSV